MFDLDQLRVDPSKPLDLSDIDPHDKSLAPDGKEAAAEETASLQAKIESLQELLYAGHEQKLLIVLQGMDTSGKDGTIRHVMSGVALQGVRVVSFKKPTEMELDHDYLWRVHSQTPAAGEIVIFNRSHYEDVLVVRVHSLVPEKKWKERYEQINAFEKLLASNGVTILKFFLHISNDEQKKRLQARLEDPTKRWKFQHGDLDERKLWTDYMRAYQDALVKTSTDWAPWYVVPADRKWYRNWVVANAVVQTLESLKMEYPQPDLSSEVVE